MTLNFSERANTGLPLSDILIVDSHAHLGPYYNFHIPFNDADGMMASMDALGIDIACIAPHLSIGPDFRSGNALAEKVASSFPKRFIGAITLNPNYQEDVIPELIKYENSAVMRAIKLHPSLHNYPAGGKIYRKIYDEAGRMDLPVATHTWFGDARCTPRLYGQIAREHPETTFLLIHSGGEVRGIGEATEAALSAENIYLETCGSLTFGIVEKMVDAIGSRRVVFGSDMPFIDPAAQLGKVVYAPIPEKSKRDILGRNAKRIFGLRP